MLHHMPILKRVAPTFSLPADDGTVVSLNALRGHTVVLYFYPKDDTPGCTQQACDLRDTFPRFAKSDAIILGISPDTVKSHAKFRKKYALPFTLLADTEHSVCEAYGVWQQKRLFGHRYMGVVRSTFIVDAKGKLVRQFLKVSHEGHADLVDAALRELA